MPPKRHNRLLIEAARMYYIEGLDQGRIAQRLELSRSSVSRILAKARESGIVQVTIAGDDQVSRNRELEESLRATFGLREVRVAVTSRDTTALWAVGQLAADVFVRRAPSAARIGISWGQTVGRFTEAIPSLTLRPDTKLTPLVAGMPQLDTAPSGNTVMRALADACGLRPERFDAPAMVESAATFHAMMSESTVKRALARARMCDLAFVGIGAFGVQTSRHVVEAMALTAEELDTVLAAHPAGDCLGRLFDIHGRTLGPPTSERVIGIDIDDLARIDVAVALAAGKEKAEGVLGALNTGSFDILVVDEGLAAAILTRAGQLAQADPAAVTAPAEPLGPAENRWLSPASADDG
ncbi:MAG: sugar-binding transcriptional regulator [Propioniciclava sp.]